MDSSYNLAMRNPILTANPVYSQYNQQPTTRLTLEQQYADMSNRLLPQQQPLSDPYTDYLNTLSSANDITREKILQDERYIQIYSQCELALKQTLYAQIIPSVLQTQQGRLLFEQLHTTTKTLKDEYTQLDLQRERESAELEKRLTEREKRLEEKERQIDEMLNKVNSVQTQQTQQTQHQSHAQQEQQHSPAPLQNQNKNKQYQSSNQNKPQNSGGTINE